MKNEILSIYNRLSGGKQIATDDFIITSKDFNSISCHLFIAELSKKGIVWDGEDISFRDLISKDHSPSGAPKSQTTIVTADTSAVMSSLGEAENSIGIDIQEISELPDCHDYWENEFYKTRFQNEEIAYCVTKKNPKQSFAGIYSCKEALIKCDNNLKWEDIVVRHKNSKPSFDGFVVSITHSGNFAASVAIKEGSQNKQVDVRGTEKEVYIESPVAKQTGKSVWLPLLLFFLIVVYLIIKDFILPQT